jgi:hypothetical protein
LALLRIEPRASPLLGTWSTTWAMPSDLFLNFYFVFETGSHYLLPELALNSWPTCLCLLSSWDCRCAPPYPALIFKLKNMYIAGK